MLTYQIRGGLGTQVLNLMAAYGDAFDKGQDIKKVVLNFYNYPPGLREVNINFLSQVLLHKFDVETTNGTDKFPIFNEERIKKVHKHIDRIRQVIPVVKPNQKPAGMPIMHVRQIDRPLVPLSTYRKLVCFFPRCMVIGDDVAAVSRVMISGETHGETFKSPHDNDSVQEWFMVYNSRVVVGGFSSYILSAALLNPRVQYLMLSKKTCSEDLITENDWKCLDLFTKLFDNIDWMEYTDD